MKGYQLKNDDGTITHADAASSNQGTTLQQVQSGLSTKADTSSLAPVATSGAYNDLSGKPSIPSAQVQSDWTQSNTGSIDFVKNKPVLYKSGVRKGKHIEYTTSSTVSGGSVTFYLTDNGLAGGNAIATTWFKESANFWVEDVSAQYQFGNFTISADKKSVTASITRLSATSTILSLVSVLTGLTFIAPANGTVVYLTIKGE